LIPAFIKFKAKLSIFLTQILRILQLNLFERRPLVDLFKLPDKIRRTVSHNFCGGAKSETALPQNVKYSC